MAHYKIVPPLDFPKVLEIPKVQQLAQDLESPKVNVSYFGKCREFASHPQTKVYLGRTVFIITVAAILYTVYKNRRRIYCTCVSILNAAKNRFSRSNSDGSNVFPKEIKTVNVNIAHPLNVNIRYLSEEGKSSSEKDSPPSTPKNSPKASPRATIPKETRTERLMGSGSLSDLPLKDSPLKVTTPSSV